ncbi:SLC13/DASS family transporter, partial [Cereibacter sphaeroides]|uniref:SLC13 family permease n=1 Tax=Cereibacter sphaeroides TaxID=1063 RepID=UPI000ECB70CB
ATELGGMITLVGTNGNLAVQGVMENQNVPVFGFFEFAYIGIPLTIIGIIYMMTIGYKLIPDHHDTGTVIGDLDLSETETENKNENHTTIKQVISVSVLLIAIIFMVFE